MCGRLDEDGGHLVLKCKQVKEAWRALNLEEVRCDLARVGSAVEMEGILKLEPKVQVIVVNASLAIAGVKETNGGREETGCRGTH